MKTLVIRFYHNTKSADIENMLKTLFDNDKKAKVHDEWNIVTRWVDTALSIDYIMSFECVEDCIESTNS